LGPSQLNMKNKFLKLNIFFLTIILTCCSLTVFAETAAISIKFGNSPGQVNPLIWGTNLVTDSDTGEGVWAPGKNDVNSEMAKIARKAGIKFLRFPGGCLAHNYNWRDGIGPAASRPEKKSIWGNNYHNKFGLAEFIKVCRALGATPIMTVSYFTESPASAAEFVEYCNGAKTTTYGALRKSHGYPEPFNIKYWEIGNEVWHGTAVPHENLPLNAVMPVEYAHRFVGFSKSMKGKDPSILIGAVGMEPGWYSLDSFALYWNRNLIEIAKPYIDFIVLHSYLPGYQTKPSSDPSGHFQALMAAPQHSAYGIKELQLLWEQKTDVYRPPLKFAFTEYHAGFLTDERFSWGGALYLADFVMMMLEPGHQVIGSNYMEHANGFWGMFKGYGPVEMRPDAQIFALLSQNVGNKILAVDITSPVYDPPDIGFIRSSNTLLAGTNTLSTEENLADDAGFEKGAFNTPWQYQAVAGATAKIDSTIKHSGKYSTRVDFDGSQDTNFFAVYQDLALKPGETYRLSGYIRTENLKDTHGVSLALMDANNWELFNIHTQFISGTNEWTWVEKTFRIPPQTSKVLLMLRRFAGEGKISGSAWFDDISIVKYKALQKNKVPLLAAFASETENGETCFLWVINRSPSLALDTTISFSGTQAPTGRYSIKTIVGNSQSETSLFASNIKTTASEQSFVAGKIQHKFEPASLTIISFKKSSRTLPAPEQLKIKAQ